jgi:hypothetical protein
MRRKCRFPTWCKAEFSRTALEGQPDFPQADLARGVLELLAIAVLGFALSLEER